MTFGIELHGLRIKETRNPKLLGWWHFSIPHELQLATARTVEAIHAVHVVVVFWRFHQWLLKSNLTVHIRLVTKGNLVVLEHGNGDLLLEHAVEVVSVVKEIADLIGLLFLRLATHLVVSCLVLSRLVI